MGGLGPVLGGVWCPLGFSKASSANPQQMWTVAGTRHTLLRILGLLEALARLGGLLGRLGGILRPLGAVLAHLGGVLGRLGAVLGLQNPSDELHPAGSGPRWRARGSHSRIISGRIRIIRIG